MNGKTGIEWTEATWNPVTGCTKVSAGCKNCYAERITQRFGGDFSKIELHEGRLDWPLHHRKPVMIFVNSMSDLFHESVPFGFIDKVFAVMAMSPRHTFQVLTKRPERMAKYTTSRGDCTDGVRAMGRLVYSGPYDEMLECECSMPLSNVWLGTSVEDQATADERIPHLLRCPAAVRFISYEPALGPVDLSRHLCTSSPSSLHWVICGGECGPKARPMHPDWARSVRDQCRAAGVPFFFKQWGEWLPLAQAKAAQWGSAEALWKSAKHLALLHPDGSYTQSDDGDGNDDFAVLARVGKKKAGAVLDEREWRQMPK